MASESKTPEVVTAPLPEAVVLSGNKNPRGIPEMLFIEDIDAFLTRMGTDTESVLQHLTVMHGKYKLMESGVLENRARTRGKIPDIETSLQSVRALKDKKERGEAMDTFFNLSDQVYAKARVDASDRVCLWLGANVMLEYSYDEAEALLVENLRLAEGKRTQYEEDLSFVREQIITTEVNMARVYNFDVKKRRAAAKAASAGGSA